MTMIDDSRAYTALRTPRGTENEAGQPRERSITDLVADGICELNWLTPLCGLIRRAALGRCVIYTVPICHYTGAQIVAALGVPTFLHMVRHGAIWFALRECDEYIATRRLNALGVEYSKVRW